MWRNILEHGQSSVSKTLSKSLWQDANLVRHANYLLDASDAKCLTEVDTASEITVSISQMPTRISLLTIRFKVVIFSIGKKLRRQEDVHGYRSWWLGSSLWHRDGTQIASDWVRGGDSKTHKRLTGTRQDVIPVIPCQFWSSFPWKQ